MSSVSFSYNGKQYSAEEGITLAEALRSNGIRLGNRSMRLRVWRDEYHPFKEVPSAWVCVDGIANVNAYRVRIRAGMVITQQTRTSLLAYIGRYSGTGFYYRNFTRSEFARNFFFERVRRANDYGGPLDPERAQSSSLPELQFSASEHHEPDVLIIGAGRSGLAALLALEVPKGKKVLLIDNSPGETVESNFRQLLMDLSEEKMSPAREFISFEGGFADLLSKRNATLLDGTTVFGAFNGGEFSAVKGYSRIILVKPKVTILCTGSEEVKPVFRRNDIPGVITSRSLLSMPPELNKSRRLPVLYLESALSLNYLARIASAVKPKHIFLGFDAGDVYRQKLMGVFAIGSSEITNGVPFSAGGTFNIETLTVITPEGNSVQLATDMLVVAGRKQPRAEIGMLLALSFRNSRETHTPLPVVDEKMLCADGIYACGSMIFPYGNSSLPSALVAGAGASVRIGAKERKAMSQALASMFTDSGETHLAKQPSPDPRSVLCPCLDVTLGDMKRMYSEGYETINRMRRFSGLFMGPCQGARCYRNTYEAFAQITGKEADLPTVRPPLVPVYLGALALTDLGDES